jgi:beta-glucosidase
VGNWFTINEPQVIVGLGHCTGIHAPGLQLQKRELVHVTHNILRSHGAAVETIRARSILPSKAGIAPVCPVAIPVDNGQQNIEAAGAAMFNVTDKDLFTGWSNSWWLDPIFKGEYPEDGLKLAARYLPANFQDHMKSISVPTDFLGNNHYEGIYVSANKDGTTRIHPPKEGEPLTGFNWRVTPEGLYWGPRFLYERYNKPIIITENGLSNKDWVALDGKVHDPQRIDFTQRYLREFQRAAADGVDAAGYFHWSIMDNFEWAFGYKERFGLIHVDFETQKRTLKDSAYWYSDIIKSNGKNL